MLPEVYPSNNHVYRTSVKVRLVEVTMMHTAMTVAANSVMHMKVQEDNPWKISWAHLGLVSPIATDNVWGSLG